MQYTIADTLINKSESFLDFSQAEILPLRFSFS